jgi:hypothetical protein
MPGDLFEDVPGGGAGARVGRRGGRLGRPPGVGNRRSGDLAKMIEAVFGSTPGEQAAAIGLVTRKELKAAGGDLVVAMAAKAERLAQLLKCTRLEAWDRLRQDRGELMAYVHQRRPIQVQPLPPPAVPSVLVPEAFASSGLQPIDGQWNDEAEAEELQRLSDLRPVEVASPQSHGEPQP